MIYSEQAGSFTKIGRVVTFSFRITLSNKGSGTGDATITGLPFSAFSGNGNYGTATWTWANGGTVIPERAMITIDGGTSVLRLRFVNSSGNYNNMTHSDFTNASDFILVGTLQAT